MPEVLQDRIDVLIDLSGHTTGTRVLEMSRRLAPIQGTWIGYADTTGVPNIDLRFVDGTTDPPGTDELVTERVIRLDPCFLAFKAVGDVPKPGPAAVRHTFGSFNNAGKISGQTIRRWSAVMRAVPEATLLIKAQTFGDPEAVNHIASNFEEHGIDRRRLEIRGYADSKRSHLEAYNEVDVALDTSPYNGTTTTCEALWMGVPTVTLEGDRHGARVGASLLGAAGLGQFVARDEDGFVEIAAREASQASDRDRDAFRALISASSLCDSQALTDRFMAAIRDAWAEWCAAQA